MSEAANACRIMGKGQRAERLDQGQSAQGSGRGAPTMPTFLPGPAPLRTRGEYMVTIGPESSCQCRDDAGKEDEGDVRPAQSIGAACLGSRPSGMPKTKRSWTRTAVE